MNLLNILEWLEGLEGLYQMQPNSKNLLLLQ